MHSLFLNMIPSCIIEIISPQVPDMPEWCNARVIQGSLLIMGDVIKGDSLLSLSAYDLMSYIAMTVEDVDPEDVGLMISEAANQMCVPEPVFPIDTDETMTLTEFNKIYTILRAYKCWIAGYVELFDSLDTQDSEGISSAMETKVMAYRVIAQMYAQVSSEDTARQWVNAIEKQVHETVTSRLISHFNMRRILDYESDY